MVEVEKLFFRVEGMVKRGPLPFSTRLALQALSPEG